MVLDNAGIAKPVAINQTTGAPGAAVDIDGLAATRGVEGADDLAELLFLRADTDDIDAQGQHIRNFMQQVVALC